MRTEQVYNLFRDRKPLKHGLFITFEGLDGSGKNTHVTKLVKHLQNKGYSVLKVSFPDYNTLIGRSISAYLRGEYGDIEQVPYELICIAYAADRTRLKDKIETMLNNGYVVIADRYTYSNVFTAAKMPKEKRMEFINWIEEMEFSELGVVKPDYNFYLHVDPSVSIKRIEERGKREYQKGKEDIHENNSKLLTDTAETYLNLAKDNEEWIIINQMKNNKQLPIDEVFEDIKTKVEDLLSDIPLK